MAIVRNVWDLGAALRKARVDHGLTQGNVAAMLDCPLSQIWAIEGGSYVPDHMLLFRLLRLYNLEIRTELREAI